MYDDLGTDLLLLRFTAIFRPSPPPPSPQKKYTNAKQEKIFSNIIKKPEFLALCIFMHI